MPLAIMEKMTICVSSLHKLDHLGVLLTERGCISLDLLKWKLSACIYCLAEEQESSDGDSTSSSESEYEDESDGQEEAFNEAIKMVKKTLWSRSSV